MNIDYYGPAPKYDPVCYPGQRPSTSFLFCGDHISPIKMMSGKKIEDCMVDSTRLADKLKQYNAKDIDQRYMVIGYGSNINPPQLQSKFKNYKDGDCVFPVLKGTITGYDVSYACSFASYGSIPATITNSPKTTVDVWANLLDADQLKKMDKSEGRDTSYYLVKLDGELILKNNEKFTPAYSYVHAKGSLSINDSPVRIDMISASNSIFPKHDQKHMLLMVADKLGIDKTKPSEIAAKLSKDRCKYKNIFYSTLTGIPTMGYEKIPCPKQPLTISDMSRSF